MYTAKYLPALGWMEESPDKSGFPTKEAAWNYILENCLCESCKEERQRALSGKSLKDEHGDLDSTYPPCTCEWMVGLTEEMQSAETFEDILIAGGAKKVKKDQDGMG